MNIDISTCLNEQEIALQAYFFTTLCLNEITNVLVISIDRSEYIKDIFEGIMNLFDITLNLKNDIYQNVRPIL